MGYPMTYRRVVSRNALHGDYDATKANAGDVRPMIAGDLRRLELDSRDPRHLESYAMRARCTKEQVKAILDYFFEGIGA